MPSRFCFVCGKPAGKLFQGLCGTCYGERSRLVQIPPRFELVACSRCGFVRLGNKWQRFDAGAFLKSKMKINGELGQMDVKQTDETFVLTATGRLSDVPVTKTETHKVTIHMKKIVCPACTRRAGGYYEAVLQLRGAVSDDVLDFIAAQIAKQAETDERAFYTAKELKEGIDLRLGSKKAAEKIAKQLEQKYRAKLTRSFELVTKRDGKEICRTVIAVRLT